MDSTFYNPRIKYKIAKNERERWDGFKHDRLYPCEMNESN